MREPWDDFDYYIRAALTADDDVRLWHVAVNEMFRDAEFLCRHARSKSPIYTQVGSCSHWLSPHNNGSWLADARFAWPSGYGGGRNSIFGLPEFDWSLTWRWNKRNNRWTPDDQIRGQRPLTFRVAVPARTAKHSRAVVHTIWMPASPTIPDTKLLQAYGFVNKDSEWDCTCTFGKDSAYEVERMATQRIED
jgi:hypothetical protein